MTREQMINYISQIECRGCGDDVFPHPEDAIDGMLLVADSIVGEGRTLDDLKTVLSYEPGEGKWCDHCHDVLAN
jgi:hypothetical protein